MAAYLAVVRRDQPDVFERVRKMIDGEDVSLLWDRRQAERRATWVPVSPDRRRGDRRRSPESTWVMLGFVITPAPPDAGPPDALAMTGSTAPGA
jgi:hypothetical protein